MLAARPFGVLLAVALTLTLSAPRAAAQEGRGAGVLQGRVTLAGSDTHLAGVRVRVPGTALATVTDEDGRYVLAGVDPGAVRLEFSYLGAETLVHETTVAPGATVVFDAELALPGLEETVTAQRTAQRDALNIYRASDSVTSGVSADDIGQFVDQNVAESLQRLPGISITRDQGEDGSCRCGAWRRG